MAKYQGILSFFLAQGKVRHVSIHRHKALEASEPKTGRRSGQMTCTLQKASFWVRAGEHRGGGAGNTDM